MRIFYEDGTRLFQDAAEATRDMATRGFPVTVVKTPSTPDQEEIQRLSTWQVAGRRRDRVEDRESVALGGSTQLKHQRSQYKERLKEFKRKPPQDTD